MCTARRPCAVVCARAHGWGLVRATWCGLRGLHRRWRAGRRQPACTRTSLAGAMAAAVSAHAGGACGRGSLFWGGGRTGRHSPTRCGLQNSLRPANKWLSQSRSLLEFPDLRPGARCNAVSGCRPLLLRCAALLWVTLGSYTPPPNVHKGTAVAAAASDHTRLPAMQQSRGSLGCQPCQRLCQRVRLRCSGCRRCSGCCLMIFCHRISSPPKTRQDLPALYVQHRMWLYAAWQPGVEQQQQRAGLHGCEQLHDVVLHRVWHIVLQPRRQQPMSKPPSTCTSALMCRGSWVSSP